MVWGGEVCGVGWRGVWCGVERCVVWCGGVVWSGTMLLNRKKNGKVQLGYRSRESTAAIASLIFITEDSTHALAP